METSEDVSFRDSYFYTNRVFVYDMNKSIRNTGSTHRQPPNLAAIVAPTTAAAKSPQTPIMQSKKPSPTLTTSRDRDIKSKQFYADMLALKDMQLVRGTSSSTIKSVEPVDWATFSKLDARALKPAQPPTRKHTPRDNPHSVPYHQAEMPPSFGTSVQPRKAAAMLRSRENHNSTPTTLINNNRRETYSPLSAALNLDCDNDETESEKAAMRGFSFDPDQRLTISSKDNLFIPAFLIRHKSRNLKRPPQFLKPPQPTTTPTRSKPNPSLPTTPSTAKTGTPTVSRNAQRLLKLQQYRLQRQEAPNPDQLELPAELGYETRPMSAHTPFNLRDYIKPIGMVTEKEETDDYEKRMRSLFLPSLFAGDSVDDMKNNSAKTRRVHLVAEHPSVSDEPKGDVRKTVSFQQDQPDTSKPVSNKEIPQVPTSLKPPPPPPPPLIRPTSSRGGVIVTNRPDSSDMRRRLFLPPPPTRRPASGSRGGYRPTTDDRSTSNVKLYTGTAASGTRSGVSDVYSSSGVGNLPTLRRSNSARARSANLRKRKLSTALHKPIPIGRPNLTTLATVNGAGTVVDDIPNDLSAPLLRWELAIYHVLKLNKTKKSVLDDNAGGVSVGGGGLSELTQTEIIQRAKRDRLDLVGALRVKRIYEINVGSREDKDLDILDGIIGKYHCFAKLSPVVRYKLYNCCTIETHARGAVMIREGHQARFWYILLTGECLHQLRPDTPMTVTTRVSPGGSVGEFGNLFGTAFANQETRHLRATCLMRCDFLRIEKADYLAISREAKGLDSMVFEYFTSVPAFFGVEKSILNLICQRSIVRKFDVDEVVLRAGEPCSNVYFIMKGKVRALHMVTFAKRDAGLISIKRDRRHKYILAPYKPPPPPPTPSSFLSFSLQADKASNNSKPPPPVTSGNSYLGPNDEVVRELATVLDLTNGMSFPPMRPSKVVIEQQELADAMAAAENAKNNGRRISVMTPSSTRQMSMLSTPTSKQESNVIACPFHFVVVDNKLEVIAISVQDLREILPPDTLRRVMEQRSLTDVSSQEIEERYLAALGWRNSDLDGARSLRIDSFHNDGSWSNPVVKDKFKKRDEEDPVLL